MNFDTYLISKKIDSQAFRETEPSLWESWKAEFEQLHPNSFTAQKLYLINPIRRKYTLKTEDKPIKTVDKPIVKPAQPTPRIPSTSLLNTPPDHVQTPNIPAEQVSPAPATEKPQAEQSASTSEVQNPKPVPPKPAVPRPVFKPKPKN